MKLTKEEFSLFLNHHTSTLNEEQRVKFNELMKQESYQNAYNDITSAVKAHYGERTYDAAKGLADLESKIKGEADRSTRKVWPVYMKWAASVLLLVGIGIAVRLTLKQPSQEMAEFAAPLGEFTSLELSDGSIVRLSPGSLLRYPEVFGKELRQVELSGKGFFEVTKNPEQPFIVKTDLSRTKVLGTQFEINQVGRFKETVSLFEGKVEVSIEEKSQVLSPNQKLVLDHGKTRLVTFDGVAERTSWEAEKIHFNKALLTDVIVEIERSYGVNVEVEGQKTAPGCQVSGAYPVNDLESVMKSIEFLTGAKVTKINSEEYKLTDLSCE